MNNLITIENQTAVVSLDTIIKFSGNTEASVRKLVRDNKETLVEFGLSYTSDIGVLNPDILNETELTYSELVFTESASTYLITLMKNSEQVKQFKYELVKAFYGAREVITKQLEDLHTAQLRILELQAKSKDKLIEDLSKRNKEYRVIVRDGKKYHSATSLMKDEKDTAKSFKKVMREVLDVVTVKMKLTPYYAVTETGLDSGIVVADEHGTPYYSDDCIDLYNEAKDM
jgi:hypothetical protein